MGRRQTREIKKLRDEVKQLHSEVRQIRSQIFISDFELDRIAGG